MVDAMNKQRLDAIRTVELENWWFDTIVKENLSIREKMTLLWTNHFVTGQANGKQACHTYQYLQTCRANALGNFKKFAYDISIDPAMLIYLNGNQNFVRNGKSFVNENYARELMELFTLGLIDPNSGSPNYTETDIQNAARALTGWQPSTTAPFTGVFNSALHDTTSKTFMGRTGNWGLQDVIDIIFEQGTPAGFNVAYFACQKIYQAFVYYVPNDTVVRAMANVMLQNNFEILPVMQALLSSAHFYDANVIGSMPKSPAEYMGSLVREFALTYPAFDPTDPPAKAPDSSGRITYTDTNQTLTLITQAAMSVSQGQELLNPPNVKGWPGGHNWISTGTFQNREVTSYTVLLSNSPYNSGRYKLAFDPTRYATQVSDGINLPADDLARALEDLSLAFTLGPRESGDLSRLIHGAYPEPRYQFNAQGVSAFAQYLTNLPEFQLI
jgi:uncharacterized protein (DUF1800 family)